MDPLAVALNFIGGLTFNRIVFTFDVGRCALRPRLVSTSLTLKIIQLLNLKMTPRLIAGLITAFGKTTVDYVVEFCRGIESATANFDDTVVFVGRASRDHESSQSHNSTIVLTTPCIYGPAASSIMKRLPIGWPIFIESCRAWWWISVSHEIHQASGGDLGQ